MILRRLRGACATLTNENELWILVSGMKMKSRQVPQKCCANAVTLSALGCQKQHSQASPAESRPSSGLTEWRND
jgi:hypothetical protein